MKKILLLTNADMSLQSGNVVLVLRRAEEIFRLSGIETLCVVVRRGFDAASVRHVATGIKFAAVYDKKGLKRYLNPEIFGTVVIYGELLLRYIGYIRRWMPEGTVKILLDMQGSFEEQIAYSSRQSMPLNYFKYVVKQYLFYQALNYADGIIVVTDVLGSYCRKYVKKSRREKLKTYRIRCGINEILDDGFRLSSQEGIRKEWGIRDTTPVLVFSGYRMHWQKIDDIIALFKKCDRTGEDVFFAFFCNTDPDFEASLKQEFPRGNYIVTYLSFAEYFRHLCACDAGFLMRDDNLVNRVAFPNKFSDYLNAGLLVAVGDALEEPSRILDDCDMPRINTDTQQNPAEIFRKCLERRSNLESYYAKCDVLCEKELLLRRQIVQSGIIEFISGS